MPATVIPVKGLYLGFVGNISNEGYSLRTARQVNPTDTNNIAFGETFVLNTNNTYSSLKTYIQNGGSLAFPLALGIAASNVNINPTYSAFPGSQDVLTPGGVYVPSAMMDGLVQGTINVSCNNGTPTAGGNVYIRTATDSAIPAGVVGGLEAQADTNTVATTATAASGASTITVASATNLLVGQVLTGTGLQANTTITSITGTSVGISLPTTAALSATAVTASTTLLYPNFKWKTGYLETDLTAQVTILQRLIA